MSRCSYSLSGSVHLKLSKTSSLFPSGILRRSGTPTTTNVVLTSLIVTFEGKSEHQQEGGNYSAARLCTVSQQLLTSPITLQLSNDESSHASHYDIIFDLLTIPGWLPATFTGTDSTYNAISSTSYSLFATATYHIETLSSPVSPQHSSFTSTFCNLMQTCNPLSGWLSHANKKSHADRVDIEIVRHLVSPPSSTTNHASNHTSIFPPTTFSISAQAKESSPISNDVVSRLSIVASIPGFVSTTEKSIPISLKARFKDNDNNEDASDKLAIERVEIDIDQSETFYAKPDDQYTSRFALPSEQPPTHPLLHRSVSDSLEHLGFIANENKPKKWVKTKSVLDPLAPSSFFLDAQDGDTPTVEGEDKPYTLSADWSIIKMAASLRKGKEAIPATHISPFLRVTHTLNIALYIKYGNDKKDLVQFPLPINFVVLPPATTAAAAAATPTPVPSITTTTTRSYEPLYLPAYTQLFHEDGEARVDLSRGVPPAYRDKVSEGQEDGVMETFGRTVKKPELVPVGTTEVDWNSVQRLLD